MMWVFDKEKRLKALILISILLVAVLMFFNVNTLADEGGIIASGTCGDNLTWSLDNQGTLTISGSGDMYDYNTDSDNPWYDIRNNIQNIVFDGNAITSIGDFAFFGCSDLISIILPDSIDRIGKYAFSLCSSLNSITIPENVTVIGEFAFFGCREFENITIPEGVTSIGIAAFQECSGLNSVSLPNSITCIEDYMFSGCVALESISLPETITSIGNSAFTSCKSFINIDIPDGVTSIGNAAFRDCINLESIILPDSITSIGVSAFFGCRNLISITIPESVNKIGNSAFRECISLTSITIPESITSIEDSTFEQCVSLESITITENVTSIGNRAFYNCANLESMVIPEKTTKLGKAVFWNCYNLQSISIPAGVSEAGANLFGNSSIQNVFYKGTESDWEDLNIDTGFATMFTIEDHSESLLPEISIVEISGGIVVTIESAGSEIFYTLDGSIPCTASIPYEGTFILDEAGEYFINARAFNLDEGQCSLVSTEYVNLEQSERPEISERNGQVTITGEGNIYYSLDVTEDPTTDSYRYTASLRFSETTVIKARCIEEGRAASEVAGYVYYAGSSEGIIFPEESYSFENTKQSFGYTGFVYKISEDRYMEIFGSSMGHFLYDEYGKDAWGGSCFGMSATSILFHKGMLTLGDYSDEADDVYELLAPASPDSMLTKLIERYQISQFLPEVMEERGDISEGGNMVISGLGGNETEAEALLDAVRSGLNGGDPVILIVWRQDLAGSHAVVPYKVEDGKIYVYDCNNPGKERYITYKVNNNGAYSFGFGEYSYAVSYNLFSTLMNGLESNVDIETAILSSEEESRMLISIDSTDVTILDEKGNEVDLISYRTTEDLETDNTVVCIKTGTYKIINKDLSLDSITVSAATDDDYQKVTVSDSGSVIEVRERNGKVYFCITSEAETDIAASAVSSKGFRNSLSLHSDYAEIYSTTDRTVIIRTKASTATINGEEQELIIDESDTAYYLGAAVSPDAETGARLYREGEQYTLSTDITSLPGEAFNLTAFAAGGNENTILYAASYSDTGRMIALKGVRMTAGKTRYVFGIEKSAAEVKVFMVSADKYRPLINNVAIK